MPQKQTIKKVNTKNKISEKNSDILAVPKRPIKKTEKTKKINSNSLYKKFLINKNESDRINFDEIYNKQKRNTESNINFISQEINTLPSQSARKTALFFIIFISLFFIIFCFFGLFFYKESLNKQIENLIKNNEILDEIYKKEKNDLKQVKTIAQDLEDIFYIYKNNKNWSKFIFFLEQNIVKDVYIKDIFAKENEDIVISFKTNDYENISKQILIFKSLPDVIKSYSIHEAKYSIDDNFGYNINFNILFKINTEFLLKNE